MTEDEKRELADAYEQAANWIDTHGWFGNRREHRSAPACFAIALQQTSHYTLSNKAFRWAVQVLELPLGITPIMSIFEWNDDPSRTKDEVINVLHGLANKLR